MTTLTVTPSVTVAVDAGPATHPTGGTVQLDALRVPYASATLTLPLTEDTVLEGLDPRQDHRLTITGGDPAARTFNLGLRGRDVDHKARTVTIDAASDEALLVDYATLTEDAGARAHEASLRAVCNYVLGKIGATLAAGADDADATAYWALVNKVLNPSGESTTGFYLGDNATNIAVSGITPLFGYASVSWQAVAAGNAYLGIPLSDSRVTPGQPIVLSGYMRTSGSGQTGQMHLWFLDEHGTPAGFASATRIPLPTPYAWARSVLIATVPPGAVTVSAWAVANATAANVAFGLDGIMLYDGSEEVGYFDGASLNDAHYTYTWAGAVNGSASSRTPTLERHPDLYVWKPGVSAWDFLAPFTTPAALRLFCDEARVWRLIDPDTYTVPGVVTVTAANATEGIDAIHRDDPEVFATGVVVYYEWTDWTGTQQRAYDSAGTPEKVVTLTYQRAYPGPGAAAAILARRNGMGHTQRVEGLTRWDATPGMAASVTMPGTAEQLGTVKAVDWAVDDSGLMNVDTRSLVDVVPASWLDWDPLEAWQDVDPAVTWDSLPT